MKRGLFVLLILVTTALLISISLPSCSGKGGGEDNPLPTIGTGADNVPIFWMHYGAGFGGGFSVRQTTDGGFVAAGYLASDASILPDIYVLKTDLYGAVQWEKTFGGAGRDIGQSVAQTGDGGYIIGGCLDCDAGQKSFYLLKLDSSGNKVWDKSIPGASLSGAYAVEETKSGNPDGYVLVGSDASQGISLIVTDPTGSVRAQRSFKSTGSTAGWDVGFAVEQTGDGGFIIAGCHGADIWLIRTDGDGAKVWDMRLGTGEGWAVRQTADGGYLLAGRTTKSSWFGGTEPGDAIVVKTDSSGNEVWRKTFGGAEDDEGRSLALTLDGGYVIAGKTLSYSPGPVDHNAPWQWEDVFLMKLDAAGNTLWQKVKGHLPNVSDGGASVAAVSDGGYIVAGNSNAYDSGNILLMKTDKNGDTVRLGDQDLTLTVTAAAGTINFTNAIEAAAAGARGFTLPRDVGSLSLDLLTAAANADPVADFCSSGSYSAALVPAPVQEGSELTVSFLDCKNGSGDDERILSGGFTLKVESLSGTLASSGTYTVDALINPVGISSVSSSSTPTSTITGAMRFRRISTSGNYAERAQSVATPSPATLTYRETGNSAERTCVVGPFAGITDNVASSGTGSYSFGSSGETVTVDLDSIAGALTATVLEPVTGAAMGMVPASGSFRVTAGDNSSMTVVMSGDRVTLSIDTDGDGTIDGTVSTTWDYMY